MASCVFRRFRSLRSMGLKAAEGQNGQWWVRVEREGLSLVLPLPLKALRSRPPNQAVLEAAGGWVFLPPSRPLMPSAAPLTLQAGVRDLLHVLLHQAPLAARHLAAQVPLHTLPGYRKQGWSGPRPPGLQSSPISVQADGTGSSHPSPPSGPAGPPAPKLPLQQFLAPEASLLLT